MIDGDTYLCNLITYIYLVFLATLLGSVCGCCADDTISLYDFYC
jgi:hypothetical protein